MSAGGLRKERKRMARTRGETGRGKINPTGRTPFKSVERFLKLFASSQYKPHIYPPKYSIKVSQHINVVCMCFCLCVFQTKESGFTEKFVWYLTNSLQLNIH